MNIDSTEQSLDGSITDLPESLWPEVSIVLQRAVDCLAFELNWCEFLDGEDVECGPAVPVFVADVCGPPERADSAGSRVPTLTVAVDQQWIAGTHLVSVPAIALPVTLLGVGSDAPDASLVGERVGLLITVREVDGLGEGRLVGWFVDRYQPELWHGWTTHTHLKKVSQIEFEKMRKAKHRKTRLDTEASSMRWSIFL